MSTRAFRSGVVSEVVKWAASEFPELPIIYENGPVPDEDKIGPIWLDISIRWYGAQTKNVGEFAAGRHTGVVSAQVFAREGSGTAKVDDILDSLTRFLATKRIGSGIVMFPEHNTPNTARGWYKSGLMFPFWLDITR